MNSRKEKEVIKRNAELKQQLAANARKLKIETGLEKVRAIALKMKKPADMLEVCKTISLQLQKLGVNEIRNVQTAIFYESKGAYMNYEYYAKHKKTFITETVYTNHKVAKAFAAKMLSGKGEIFITHIKGKKVKDWIAYQKTTNVFIDRLLEKANSLNYYWHSLGPVALGISTYDPLSEEELNLFKRFVKVFELAYTRFIDIEQAIAQAREAKIETALERVRARTMAMQKSDELPETSYLLFQQVKELGLTAVQNSIAIIKEETGFVELSTTVHGHHLPHTLNVPINDPYVMAKAVAAWKAKHRTLKVEIRGQELKDYNEHRNSFFETKVNFPEDQWIVNIVLFSKGWLSFSSNKNISDETFELLKRFAAVFEQTYTRFNDLQQAEAQARESQIQLALERVRARTMAMHHSNELADVATVLFQQVKSLGVPQWTCGFCIWEIGDTECMWYSGSPDGEILAPGRFPLTEHPVFRIMDESRKRGDELFIYEKEGEMQADHYRYMMTLPGIRERLQNMLDAGLSIPTFQIDHYANFSHGNLVFITYEHFPEMHDIFKRFAKVFEQTYTRFLDLQKAEAQARESQIQLALERVRARTMAMQRSDELSEAASLLFQQVQSLGAPSWTAGYCIWDEDKKAITLWVSSPWGDIQPPFRAPLEEKSFFIRYLEADNRGLELYIEENSGKALEEMYQYLLSLPVVSEILNSIMAEGRPLPTYEVDHCAYFSKGFLLFITYQQVPELHDIFKRFASVFDQTYTRFLDLQKAEAQAREAQIENGLERVRSRSLAMHNTSELQEVIHTVHKELLNLNIAINGGSFIAINKDVDTVLCCWGSGGTAATSEEVRIPLYEHPFCTNLINRIKSAPGFFTEEYTQKEKKDFFTFLFKHEPWSKLDAKQKDETLSSPGGYTRSCYVSQHTSIFIINHFGKKFSAADNDILQRFGKVFEQAYTRFLDLQKAEAQAREAKIEAALERVRARTMGMQKSDELAEVVGLMYKQFEELDFGFYQVLVSIYDVKNNVIEWWSRGFGDVELPQRNILPIIDHPFSNDLLDKWKNGVESYQHILEGEMKKSWDEHLFTQTDLKHFPQEIKDKMRSFDHVFLTDVFMKYGSLQAAGNAPLPDDKEKILKRFTKALDHAYTRMMDLQNAEAQTREAQIEVALERIRARAMAMHSSNELMDVANILREQMGLLGQPDLETSVVNLFEEDSELIFSWNASRVPGSSEKIISSITSILKNSSELTREMMSLYHSKEKEYTLEAAGLKLMEFLNVLIEANPRVADYIGDNPPEKVFYHFTTFTGGNLLTVSYQPPSEETKSLQRRAASVFDMAYRRYLDLKKAEAQARESQIELGLERVRAKAMAMQKSDELKELIGTVYTELTKLDLILDRCFILIYDIKSMGVTWWMSNPEAPLQPIGLFVKYHEQPPYLAFIKGWKARNLKWQYVLEGEVKKTWDKFLFVETELSQLPDFVIANMKANEKVYLSASFNNFGCLTLATLESLSDEHFEIMLRFAKVFDLTYTRFNDLKQAEAQAREAKIEAALERVRAKAMAMHKSEDLNPAVATVFEELDKLNIGILRCGIAIMDKEKPRGDVWITVKSEQSNTIQVSGDEPLDYHPILRGAYDGWLKQEDFSYVLQGKDLINYYRDVASMKYQLPVSTSFDTEKNDQQQYYYNSVFHDGSLFAFMETAITVEVQTVIKRFANVFNLTYKRFLDLQKAEAQTREAKIETALERVRARALAMQDPEELKDVAQVLRTEMGLLGVEELETCSIYINDEATNKTECWYALKDLHAEEKKLVSDHFPLNLNDTWVGREMKIFYRSDAKRVSIVMQGANRKEWINYCEERSVPFRGYYGEVIPDRTYHLYKFSHGAIGAAAAGDISAESWKLLSRAASVFSLAYSRFKDLTQARNDLIKLKEEKKRAEDALTNLQVTQKQLVQAEKMASLGELTAGIAHEIQNPLNFVNNFSDVSNELLEEMKVELEKGNAEEAKLIAVDVKENLEKILHHGKRADAIVKGMLQHSRTSTGQKEPTDINVLAEEYLRLAYHGLRAKDKFFNAKFETDLDPSITKINIVPQEIGRVILNLINNSFYAVSEKKRTVSNGYEPSVTVSTKKINDKIEIRVKDNGNGIPQKLLDKIFQPFFTTKPTGQGTGLGLSLSYDIVTKGHDGEIKVETKEGEGSAFTISLPMK